MLRFLIECVHMKSFIFSIVGAIVSISILMYMLIFDNTRGEIVRRTYSVHDQGLMEKWGSTTNLYWYQARISHGWLHVMQISEPINMEVFHTPEEASRAISNYFTVPEEDVIKTYTKKNFIKTP